jgi:1-acyl-sn-glycerol-3-phosphate acyltransferase
MRHRNRARVRTLLRRLNPTDYARFERIRINDLGFGYDPFGLEIESAMAVFTLLDYAYKYWFRVESFGVENVPEEGPALVAPNHSGFLPIDGAMIAIDLIKKMNRPRVMRSVLYNSAGFIPFAGTFFYRSGQISGARRNFEEALRHNELVAAFPEGSKGTWKGFRDRYRLRPFNVGFMELSLQYRTPIVPTAVIGAEEQYPFMMNAKPIARMLNLPYFPVSPFFPLLGPVGMLPLPAKYRIYYGEPFHFYREYGPEAVGRPEVIRMLVGKVQNRIEAMIAEGLRNRRGVFGLLSPSAVSSLPRKILSRLAGSGPP